MVLQHDFLALGLEIAGFRRWKQHADKTNLRHFRSIYGTSPLICQHIWHDLTNIYDSSGKPAIHTASQPLFLLLTLRWFKTYETEMQLGGLFSMSPKTIRKHLSAYSAKLQLLKNHKVCKVCLGIVQLAAHALTNHVTLF